MDNNNLKHDESKNEEVEKSCENAEEAKVNVDDCINNIAAKPVVNVTTDIEGLETSMTVADENEKVTDKNAKNDCDSENEELNENSVIHGCINTIIIEPVVEINTDIKGLVTSVKVAEMDEKMADKTLQHDDNRNTELEETADIKEGVNCIVVKPIVKIDVDISGLKTVPAG
ncbi:MAG: hypothetical protein MJB12_03690 [Firmicutes bacterium]|nr:hypothetical protein [Bacillota bacterium]